MYYYLTINFQRFRGTTIGTGVPHINKKIFKELYIPLPSLEEQKRIADILSMIDSGIGTVDRAVAKLEGMKRTLLNELLTGRIRVREENGKLTFYKETEFQDTEIGKIPKDWKTEKLSSLATIIMGQSPPSTTYNKEGEGLPFIQGKMEFGKMYPSPTTYTSRPLKIAEKGDVLMSVRAPVGDVNIAPYKLCIGRGLAAIRFNPKMANNLFYFYYLQSIKSRLESLGKGSTFKAITKKDLEELRIVYLPLNEQKGIANILLTIDNAIELYYREKERFLRLRRGLMSVLLTGRVRVISDVRDVGIVA
jgi:type I restriction enzyme S subunit